MKKIFTLLLVFLAVVNPAAAAEKQKFVNPLFYKTMEPVSSMAWRTKITPSLMTRDNKGTVLKQKCTLIENTMEAVTLDCEDAYDKSGRLLYRIALQDRNNNGVFVYIFYKSPSEKDFAGRTTHIIYEERK